MWKFWNFVRYHDSDAWNHWQMPYRNHWQMPYRNHWQMHYRNHWQTPYRMPYRNHWQMPYRNHWQMPYRNHWQMPYTAGAELEVHERVVFITCVGSIQSAGGGQPHVEMTWPDDLFGWCLIKLGQADDFFWAMFLTVEYFDLGWSSRHKV